MNLSKLIFVSLLFLAGRNLEAQTRLFESDQLLKFRLVTDLHKLVNDIQDERGYHDAVIKYLDENQTELNVPVRVKTRGNFRREKEICPFPPLMLNFAKHETENGWFTGQNKLKLVTHCNTDEEVFEKYLLSEFLTYRIYNLLTDLSLRVRMVEITYSDSDQEMEDLIRKGFLIESIDNLAGRKAGKVIKPELNSERNPDYYLSTLLSVFQFMIGNTDWFLPDHNMKILALKTDTVAIPYDFDLAGLINVHYSSQYKNLGLSHPRDRYYLGFCRTNDEFRKVFAQILDKRKPIRELIEGFPYLESTEKQDLLNYLEEFYKIIDDPADIPGSFLKTCGDDF